MQRRQLLKNLWTLMTAGAIGGLSFAALAKPGRPASPTSVAGVHRVPQHEVDLVALRLFGDQVKGRSDLLLL
jgi:hypothetical protein